MSRERGTDFSCSPPRSVLQHRQRFTSENAKDTTSGSPHRSPPRRGTADRAPPVAPPAAAPKHHHRVSSLGHWNEASPMLLGDHVVENGRTAAGGPAHELGSAFVDGRRFRLQITGDTNCFAATPHAGGGEHDDAGGGCLTAFCGPNASVAHAGLCVPLREVIGVVAPAGAKSAFSVMYVQRPRRSGIAVNRWRAATTEFSAGTPAERAAIVGALRGALDTVPGRPHRLLVFVNPFGGRGRAPEAWDKARVVLQAAGCQCRRVDTTHAGHCREAVENLTENELARLDGIVVVGGDGLFQEALTGLLELRARSQALFRAGASLRLAHIPAGSTDAVAWSVNGTRSVEAAAIHVAIGDDLPLDVARTDGGGTTRFHTCLAAYGFMGDVMARSEGMRMLGPARYDLAGVLTVFQNNRYKVRVTIHPPETASPAEPCGVECRFCAGRREDVAANTVPASPHVGGVDASAPSMDRTQPGTPPKAAAQPPGAVGASPSRRGTRRSLCLSSGGAQHDDKGGAASSAHATWDAHAPAAAMWRPAHAVPAGEDDPCSGVGSTAHKLPLVVEGVFRNILCCVGPCRSDKSVRGIAPNVHLCSGTMHVILVPGDKRSPLGFLASLARMGSKGFTPTRGGEPGPGGVRVFEATAVRVEAAGGEAVSSWNVDGEVLRTGTVESRMHRGLVRMFARGPEGLA